MSKQSIMAEYRQPPSTPPRQIARSIIDDMVGDLIVPGAPRKERSTKAFFDQSNLASTERIQSGRIAKPRSIMKKAVKITKTSSARRRVHFADAPSTPKVMEPLTTPSKMPRHSTPFSLCDLELALADVPSTSKKTAETTGPPPLHHPRSPVNRSKRVLLELEAALSIICDRNYHRARLMQELRSSAKEHRGSTGAMCTK